MLSFREVDPSVLGSKYRKVKKEEPKEKDSAPVVEKPKREGIEELLKPGNYIEKEEKTVVSPAEVATIKFEGRGVEALYSRPILSPCPFCRGEARLKTDTVAGTYMAQIRCLKCGAAGPRVYDKAHDGEFVFKALDMWNGRA